MSGDVHVSIRRYFTDNKSEERIQEGGLICYIHLFFSRLQRRVRLAS